MNCIVPALLSDSERAQIECKLFLETTLVCLFSGLYLQVYSEVFYFTHQNITYFVSPDSIPP